MKVILAFIFLFCAGIRVSAQCTDQQRQSFRAAFESYRNTNTFCYPTYCFSVRFSGQVLATSSPGVFYEIWERIITTNTGNVSVISHAQITTCTRVPKISGPPSPPPNSCAQKGSVIHPHSQTLGESVPLAGAPFDLNYFTNRVRGHIASYKINVQLSDSFLFSDLVGMSLEIIDMSTSATVVNAPFAAAVNQFYNFSVTTPTGYADNKFQIKMRENFASSHLEHYRTVNIGDFRAEVLGLGGWYPSNLYFYSFLTNTIHNPDGTKREVSAKPGPGVGEFFVAEEFGKEVYIFNNLGFHLRTVTSLLGSTLVSFQYNMDWSLDRITSRSGLYTQFNRNMSGELVSITTDSGKTSSVVLTADGYLQSITDPLLKTYSMTYDGTDGILATFQKPTLEVSTFTYDADKNLTKDEHSGGKWSTLVYTLSPTGEPQTNFVTREGLQTSFVNQGLLNLNVYGGASKVTNSSGSSQFRKTSAGDNETYTNYSKSRTWNNDPRFGAQVRNVTNETDTSLGASRSNIYTQTATLTAPTDPWSVSALARTNSYSDTTNVTRTINSVYTPATKTWVTTTAMGRTSTTVLDSDERPSSVRTGNLHPVTYTYEMDQVKTVAHTAARTTTFNYDVTTRNLLSVVDPLNQTTSYTYDNNERMITKTFPDLQVVQYQYDDTGRLTGITPPSRPQHVFSINSQEQVGSYLAPTQVQGLQYAYDYDNKMTSITKPDSTVMTFGYHATSYDLMSMSTPATTISYTRHATNRLISQISHSNGYKVNQTFAFARLKTQELRNPANQKLGEVRYFFNNRGGLSSFSFLDKNNVTSTTNYTYNADEYPTAVGAMTLGYSAMPNGLLNQTVIQTLTENITNSDFNEVTNRNVTDGVNTYFTEDLIRDDLGRITQRIMGVSGLPTVTYNYVYNSRGQLEEVQDGSFAWIRKYTYDNNGNRLTKETASPASLVNYTTNTQDQLTASGVYTYTYNLNGEILTRTNTLLSQTASYVYDDFGNLTQVTLENGDIIQYQVDGLNRRISKKKNGVFQRFYVWMENQLMAELNADQTLLRRYIYATKSHVPDYYVEAGVNYKIITDAIGSVVMVVKASDGTIIQTLEYDEFGQVLQDSRSGELAIGFAGGLSDWDTKLVRFGVRDYDPATGRWTAKDPILFEGGDENLYGYVAADPLNAIDPSGLYQVCTRPLNGLSGEYGPLFHQYLCANGVCGGQDATNSGYWDSPGKNSNDGASGSTGVTCKEGPTDNKDCMDKCIAGAIGGSRPRYNVVNLNGGVNCQKWADDTVGRCAAQCGGK